VITRKHWTVTLVCVEVWMWKVDYLKSGTSTRAKFYHCLIPLFAPPNMQKCAPSDLAIFWVPPRLRRPTGYSQDPCTNLLDHYVKRRLAQGCAFWEPGKRNKFYTLSIIFFLKKKRNLGAIFDGTEFPLKNAVTSRTSRVIPDFLDSCKWRAQCRDSHKLSLSEFRFVSKYLPICLITSVTVAKMYHIVA